LRGECRLGFPVPNVYLIDVQVTCSVTLREYHRFRMSENMVLRRIFELKTEEEMGRKLHNEKYHNLYFSIIMVIKEMDAKFLSEYLNYKIS
jgi:hypothetical protein